VVRGVAAGVVQLVVHVLPDVHRHGCDGGRRLVGEGEERVECVVRNNSDDSIEQERNRGREPLIVAKGAKKNNEAQPSVYKSCLPHECHGGGKVADHLSGLLGDWVVCHHHAGLPIASDVIFTHLARFTSLTGCS